MLNEVDLSNVLVVDIETVSQYPEYQNLQEDWQELWNKKAANLLKNETENPENIYERAGIYAEFGKVIVIGVGIFVPFNDTYKFRIKSFFGDDEKMILKQFADLLDSRFHGKQFALAGHNGKEFDFPYLSRRMLVNGIKLPFLLDTAGKKPWEVSHIDTMELWKFGDYKNYTSLNLLAKIFGIPSPKNDIDGSMVGSVYWKEKDLRRIADYCMKDVLTTAQVLLKFKGEKPIESNFIEYIV